MPKRERIDGRVELYVKHDESIPVLDKIPRYIRPDDDRDVVIELGEQETVSMGGNLYSVFPFEYEGNRYYILTRDIDALYDQREPGKSHIK